MAEEERKPISLGKSTSIKIKKDKNGMIIGRYFGETRANKVITAFGSEIYDSLTEDERERLGNMSGTLHFVRLLGLASRTTNRSLEGYKLNSSKPNDGRYKEASKPVGIELVSDVDIEVSVIDMGLVKELMRKKRSDESPTYFDPKNDLGSRKVNAGEYFSLSLYEFLFLIIRDEYAGLFRRDETDDDWGANITFKWTNAIEFYTDGSWELKSKSDKSESQSFILPTPAVSFYARGIERSPKSNMIDIDQKGSNGWEIKPEYARFEPLMKRKPRSDRNKKQITNEIQAEVKEKVKKRSGLARKKV